MSKNKNILVTGGTGFLGINLVKRLVLEGYETTIIDNNFRGNDKRLKNLRDKVLYINGDIRDREVVEKVISNSQSVFHLAFINGTKNFYEKPSQVLEIGIKGALSTIESSIKYEIDDYFLASSSEVYHLPKIIPTPENIEVTIPDVLNPRFSYSGGKLISELLSINYFKKTNIRDVIFRPHNVFGPDMGFDHVIPEIVKKLFKATKEWSIKNVEIEIQGSGDETRAFCYIDDAIDQILALYKFGLKGNIYNIGINNEISIKRLIENIASILEVSITVIPSSLKIGSTTRRCPDISKIMALGYSPNNNFFEGLKKTVLWYKEYFKNN